MSDIANERVIGIIPARYASTRLPGKLLKLIGDKPVIQHVYERAQEALEEVIVATDDKRIYDVVRDFGGIPVMTSVDHRSGTDRCYEAYTKHGSNAEIIINIQGDEPFILPEQLTRLAGAFDDEAVDIATLITPFPEQTTYAELSDPNVVKVVCSRTTGLALYFSRSVIPFLRSEAQDDSYASKHTFYHHIGMYAYRANVLRNITALHKSSLEEAESLEQLRWLEKGYAIRTVLTDQSTIGIDTPDDLDHAREIWTQRQGGKQ